MPGAPPSSSSNSRSRARTGTAANWSENAGRLSDYGVRKAAIESYLLDQSRRLHFPAAVLHPGHLVGAGWIPLNPAANFNPAIFADLIAGREIALPNLGRETLHHVHADDVAQAFLKAMVNWSNACGESFHVVSPAAVSMAGYADSVAR